MEIPALVFRHPGIATLALSFLALSSMPLTAQEDTGWRISPERINMAVGADRPLQLLDDAAQELSGAVWSVDKPDLAEIRQEDGRAVLHAKADGIVRVTATLGSDARVSDITIWPGEAAMPLGTTRWGTHSLGRDIRDLAAVPTGDGPNHFSLEQTAGGRTYLRGITDEGIQVWGWLLPEKTQDVELVCGDWLGGALISANHAGSFTLYTVDKDGKLRWQRTLDGLRKGHAYNLEHLVHILSQSRDGSVTKLTGLNEVSGEQMFELTLPASHQKQDHVGRQRTKILCASGASSTPTRTLASRLFVNIDGFAYLAFTQNEWTIKAAECTPGAVIDARSVSFVRDERVVLWQVHPDGTYRSTIVAQYQGSRPVSESVSAPSPTGGIIPDGLGGVLLSVRWSHDSLVADVHGQPDEMIYRIAENGEVMYKLLLPRSLGPLHDEMVLGENGLGFATRGSSLIAFDVVGGKELWRWNSDTPGIEVFGALANGGCMVQTPAALVEVDSATKAIEIFKGRAMADWHGQLYRKNN